MAIETSTRKYRARDSVFIGREKDIGKRDFAHFYRSKTIRVL